MNTNKIINNILGNPIKKDAKSKNKETYKGVTINQSSPYGYYEYYSEKQGRFLKFDTYAAILNSIDKEQKIKK